MQIDIKERSIEDYGYDEPLYEEDFFDTHLVIYKGTHDNSYTVYEVVYDSANPNINEVETFRYFDDAAALCTQIREASAEKERGGYPSLNRDKW